MTPQNTPNPPAVLSFHTKPTTTITITMTPSLQSIPTATQLQAIWNKHAAPAHNASTTHPVFFTERLRKPSVGSAIPVPGAGSSPVAHGYVYQEARSANAPKL
ncbi:uncharacterized protein Triagg1_8060 [Trichoderma aggressivum f. europaeum]|uniref:Uncharacterized protein n=1 Tax=Trichoderma aggressivum f. europaeum TaxID=173218 RepID=A0AAE1IAY5_9HYPO|nr:hypothetical protein Triagg1_8060 [Trichoderma aggressivum f. europaeum]